MVGTPNKHLLVLVLLRGLLHGTGVELGKVLFKLLEC